MNVFERLDGTLALEEEERMIVESVRMLAREKIAPHAEHYDRSAQFPWDNVKAINALGLNAMFIPEAYGDTFATADVFMYDGEFGIKVGREKLFQGLKP